MLPISEQNTLFLNISLADVHTCIVYDDAIYNIMCLLHKMCIVHAMFGLQTHLHIVLSTVLCAW